MKTTSLIIFMIHLTILFCEGKLVAEAIQFSTATLSRGCESLIKEEISDDDKVKLEFHEGTLQVDAENLVDFVHCKIFWKPDLPASVLVSGGDLTITGNWSGAKFATAQIRLTHELLGLGQTVPIETIELEEGSFSLTFPIQNTHALSCIPSSRLNSGLTVFLQVHDEQSSLLDRGATLDIHSLAVRGIVTKPCNQKAFGFESGS